MEMMISQKKRWGKTMLTLIPMMGDFSWLLFQCPDEGATWEGVCRDEDRVV
jgi:hypothetical protein